MDRPDGLGLNGLRGLDGRLSETAAPLPPCLETAAIRAAQPARSRLLPAGQSSMNCLRSATLPVSFQGISEVLPIRPQGCVADQIGSHRHQNRGLLAAHSVRHARSRPPLHAGQAARCQAAVEVLDPPCAHPSGEIRSNAPLASARGFPSHTHPRSRAKKSLESLSRQTSLGSCFLGIVSESPRSPLYPSV